MGYVKVLVAIDLHHGSELLCAKAHDLASRYDAELGLIHVVEPILIDSGEELIPVDTFQMEQQMVQQATDHLQDLCRRFSISEAMHWVELGTIKTQIISIAEHQGFDLVVIGNRERHGLSLLLGSTANAVLHATNIDVLAIRIPNIS